jgi:anti-sigma regulatory factor (Ser/Thr protein kinase)
MRAGLLPSIVCARCGEPRLCAAAVPDHLRAVVVERATCPNDDPECDCRPMISIVAALDEAGMERALADFGGCVELADGRLLSGDHLLPTLESGGLYMALATTTAYSLAPAHLFCKVLAERFAIDVSLRDDLELAVHEAVVNGLLHGNLEIVSEDRQTLEGFRNYYETVEKRLDTPPFGRRGIEISAVADERSITVSVIDSGAGYDRSNLSVSDDSDRKSGRGLALIRHFAQDVRIDDGGRKLTMRFDR